MSGIERAANVRMSGVWIEEDEVKQIRLGAKAYTISMAIDKPMVVTMEVHVLGVSPQDQGAVEEAARLITRYAMEEVSLVKSVKGDVWRCFYCAGANVIEFTECGHCGAPPGG